MSYQWNAEANTYLQGTPGGTTSTAEDKDIVVEWANALEEWQTPVLTKIMSSDPVESENFQWGESTRIRLDTNLNGGINNAVTVINVAAGTGAIIQKWMVIRVHNPRAGTTDVPDETNSEDMIVESVATDAITVGTRGTAGTAAFAHNDGAIINIIGTVEPQNQSHTEAPRIRGVRKFNYPQRFQAKQTADKRYQNTPTWEHPTNPLDRDFAEEMLKQKLLLERTAFFGTRVAGEGNTKASKMAGLNQQLTTNSIDLGGQLLTPDLIDDVLTDLVKETGKRNLKIVTGIDEARLLDTSINPIRRADEKSDSLNKIVRRYIFRTGTFEVDDIVEWVAVGNVYLLDYDLIKMRPYKGLNWHKGYLDGEENAVDHDVKAISGDFTLQVKQEKAMARLFNFEMDLNQYPQRQTY